VSDSELAYVEDELDATSRSILEVQLGGGLIPWYRGGRGDPWNHVEAVMALSTAGEFEAARQGLRWLAAHQRSDGSWFAAYQPDGEPLERHVDTNAVAYVATGVWQTLLASGDRRFADELFPTVEAALDWVLAVIRKDGWLPWSVDEEGVPAEQYLLAASSSVAQSMLSGALLAGALGRKRGRWSEASGQLKELVSRGEGFADKSVFAMDWYYPVLGGLLDASSGRRRLAAGAERFIVDGCGVRCRSDGDWVTTAETAECAIAHWRVGMIGEANRLLEWAAALRDDSGAFLTGVVLPAGDEFPRGERTSYSASAVLLARDVCCGGPSARLFFPLS
jgi:hypothetical protein